MLTGKILHFFTLSVCRGPMWMLVNITIFGDAATMQEMITALE